MFPLFISFRGPSAYYILINLSFIRASRGVDDPVLQRLLSSGIVRDPDEGPVGRRRSAEDASD